MEPLTFPGTYEDDRGVEALVWRIESSSQGKPCLEISSVVRSVMIHGSEFDALEAIDRTAAEAAGLAMWSDDANDLVGCVFTGDVPCLLEAGNQRWSSLMRFRLDLRLDFAGQRPGFAPAFLTMSTEIGRTNYEVSDVSFENCLERLETMIEPAPQSVCCLTCRLSGYQVGYAAMIGMRCLRDAREQHLAATTKAAEWRVPVTELVPETYLCAQYERRVPPTSQRAHRSDRG